MCSTGSKRPSSKSALEGARRENPDKHQENPKQTFKKTAFCDPEFICLIVFVCLPKKWPPRLRSNSCSMALKKLPWAMAAVICYTRCCIDQTRDHLTLTNWWSRITHTAAKIEEPPSKLCISSNPHCMAQRNWFPPLKRERVWNAQALSLYSMIMYIYIYNKSVKNYINQFTQI